MAQNVALDIRNNRFPCEGPKALTQVLDFSNAPSYVVDFTSLVEASKISEIQTVFVDNADSLFPLIIVADMTQQRIIVPPNSQAYLAVLNLAPSFVVSSASGIKIKLHFLNIPCTNCIWSASPSGPTPNYVEISNPAVPVTAYDNIPIINAPNTSLMTRPGFAVVNASGKSISVTDTNIDTVISASNFIKVLNTGPNIAYIRYGTTAQTALITDFPVAVNESVILYSASATHLAAICASTQTATLLVASIN
jgi:hypothetical protein